MLNRYFNGGYNEIIDIEQKLNSINNGKIKSQQYQVYLQKVEETEDLNSEDLKNNLVLIIQKNESTSLDIKSSL